MTREEAQSVIMTEQKCVDRVSTDRCNRDCANCDLIMDDAVINEAYNMAIKALEQPECEDAVNKIKNASFTGSDGLDHLEMLVALNVLKLMNSSLTQPDHNPDDERKIAVLHKMVNYLLSRLERMGYVLTRTYQQDEKTMVCETKKLSDVPSAQPEQPYREEGE